MAATIRLEGSSVLHSGKDKTVLLNNPGHNEADLQALLPFGRECHAMRLPVFQRRQAASNLHTLVSFCSSLSRNIGSSLLQS